MGEKIKCLPCNLKIASLIPVRGHFATPFSKECINLKMLTMVALAAATADLRAAWTNIANQHT